MVEQKVTQEGVFNAAQESITCPEGSYAAGTVLTCTLDRPRGNGNFDVEVTAGGIIIEQVMSHGGFLVSGIEAVRRLHDDDAADRTANHKGSPRRPCTLGSVAHRSVDLTVKLTSRGLAT
jgi:hypothetical protein